MMDTDSAASVQQRNLADLQAGSRRSAALLAGAFGYVWLTLLVLPDVHVPRPAAAWVACPLLLLGAASSYRVAHRSSRQGSIALTMGMMIGACGVLLAFRSSGLAYLFIIPIILSSILLRKHEVYLVAGLSAVLTAAIAVGTLGLPAVSSEVWLPVVIIALVAIVAWLSALDLYTALGWVWHGYEQACRNEQMARTGQAELRRALKALDEATYRLERTNYMLTIARDQAEEARRLKQQFAQTISHELRTPINLIVGFTELMAGSPEHYGTPLSPAYVRDLSIVHRNACHLRSLINDVLDLSRIEAAQMGLLFEEVDPAVLVKEAVDTARSMVESRGLALWAEIEEGLPSLWLDPTRIRQVLFNILSNAARFTESGSITVTLRREEEHLEFAVSDTGPGIAAADTGRIFEEFQQADASTRRRHEGAGLGLAISRRFVELHGGRIWVESQVGRGSTFRFTLPLRRTELPALSAYRAEAPRPPVAQGVSQPILLTVTRSPAAASLLAHYVQGTRMVAVPDLEQARTIASQVRPQAVLFDRASQPLDSESLEGLGRAWGLPDVPFVTCPLPGEEQLRQQLAVDGYLIKPVSRESVWDALRPFGACVDRVLVIDDDEDFGLLLTRMLEANPVRRYQVTYTASGLQGLTLVERHAPDLVFLDLKMPDVDGLQIIARMRSNPERRNLPIIAVSGEDELRREETVGGAMVVAKAGGLRPAEIVRWVQSVVDSAVNRPAAPAKPPE
jgi:signal transduction histidine kinase/CheY-like chemotaxis protein